MNMLIRKAYADLRSAPGRTLLAIASLAIGLWGVGGILVSTTILSADLERNFLQTQPPHAVLVSKDFAHMDLAALQRRPEVESAEFRDLSLQRIEVHPQVWIPLWLFGVDDFKAPALARIQTEAGQATPTPGHMLIERDGRLISTLDVGSVARVRAGPHIREIPIDGIAFDPAQAPATQDHFIYAYADSHTYQDITGEPAHQRLLVRLRGVTNLKDVQRTMEPLVADLEAQGIHMATVNMPPFNEHPHQWQLNTLMLLQGSIGLLAFLMGSVLVSQLMAQMLAKQVRQIGILKAMGATRQQVLRIYLGMVLMLGVVASVVAIPLAVASGYAFSAFVASKLNFNILTQHLPWTVYAALVAAGLVLPLLLSLPAIAKGIRLSVHEALGDYGMVAQAGAGQAPKAPPAWLPRWLVVAGRNSLRQKKRLSVTVVTMALGVAIFSTGFNVRQSLANLLAEFEGSMRHDVQVVLNASIPREQALQLFTGIANVERIEAWNGGRGELQSRVVATMGGVGVVALPHDTDLFHPRLAQGRWLQLAADAQAPEVVFNQQAIALLNNPAVGSLQTLDIGGKTFTARLVGVVEELEKAKIYMDQGVFDAMFNPQHKVNSLMVVARNKNYDHVMKMKADMEAAIAGSDLNVLYVMSQAERVKVIYDHLNIVLSVIVFLSLVVLVVSALGMASATSISIQERTREIGVLRAVGATPAMVFQMFVAEGMLVCTASLALGLLLAWPLSQAAAVFFGRLMLGEGAALRYALSPTGLVVALFTTLAFGWLASRVPARRAVQLSTREALAYA